MKLQYQEGVVVLDATLSPSPVRRSLNRARISIVMLIATIGITIGGLLGTASPASASSDYSVNPTQACRYTYNYSSVVAMANYYYNPFSWTCYSYSFSIPWGVTYNPLGGVDMQKYCSITYPGS